MHRKKRTPRSRSARACPSQCTPAAAGHIKKVLSDLSLSFLLMSIDIKVFQTFSPRARAAPILQILAILAILLQTAGRALGTGPRAMGGPQNSATGPADLNVYSTEAQPGEKVREDLNRYSL